MDGTTTWIEHRQTVPKRSSTAPHRVFSRCALSSTAARWAARVELAADLPHAGWLAARTAGGFAHTAPTSVMAADRPFPHRRMFVPLVRQALDGCREWVEAVGRFADPRSRDRLLARLDEAASQL